MRILVLGGAGHVGSNIIKSLVQNPKVKAVYSLDNYSNGYKKNHTKGCTYIHGDARDIDKLINEPVDTVIHLAEYARIEPSFKHYGLVVENNILGTLKVIQFCLKNDCKLIYSASSAITSMSQENITNAPYTICKQTNVELIKSIGTKYPLKYAIVYFYNVYGPNENGSGERATVVEKFIQAKLKNQNVVINSPGTQERRFTHVDDIVNGVLLVMEHGQGDKYFIGAKKSYSIIALAKLINVNYSIGPETLGNRTTSHIDHTKMSELGWLPKKHLEDYILERLTSI